jgi:hypothetical protein
MARKVANVGAVKQGRNTMSRSASERGRLGVSIGGCSFSGEWAADARLLTAARQAGQLSQPSPPKIPKHEDQEISENWEEGEKRLWIENKERLLRELQAEFGPHNFEDKLQNFKNLGAAPFSVVAFHNRFLREIRNSFTIGGYFPALTGGCALGERVLNHLIRTLRDSYRGTPEYKMVYRRDSFDDWSRAIEVLEAWAVLLPTVGDLFKGLQGKRNAAIHFRPDTDTNARELALQAIHLLERIVEIQFGAVGHKPWFIENTPGATFIK